MAKKLIFAILIFLMFGIVFADVSIYQDIPDKIKKNKKIEIHITFYNDGDSPVYIDKITHIWNKKNIIKEVDDAEIGNQDVGYFDIDDDKIQIKDSKREIDFYLDNFGIAPHSYVEFKYNIKLNKGYVNTEIKIQLNDSTTFFRFFPVTVLKNTPTTIVFANEQQAVGADDSYLIGERKKFEFKVKEVANKKIKNGYLQIVFPSEFKNVESTDAFCYTFGIKTICTCGPFTLKDDDYTCEINTTLPSSGGKYVVNASVFKNSIIYNNAELIVRVIKDNIPPQFISYNFTPKATFVNNSVLLYAKVEDNVQVDKVWAEANSHKIQMTYNGTHYVGSFTPTSAGNYSIYYYANDTSGNVNTVFAGTLSVFEPQSKNAMVFVSIPDPVTKIFPYDVYVVIWNNGTENMTIKNITHTYSENKLRRIIYSEIGNEKIGYENATAETYLDDKQGYGYYKIIINKTIIIEPKNYIEWHYKVYPFPVRQGNINTAVNVSFSDGSIKQRFKQTNERAFSSKVIVTLNNYTAMGANDTIVNGEKKNYTFVITELTGMFSFYGNATIKFPTDFIDVTPLNTGDVTPTCYGNICICDISGLSGDSLTCKISATYNGSANITYNLIWANVTGKNYLHSKFVKSSSEIILRKIGIPYDIIPPTVWWTRIEPNYTEQVQPINLTSFVTDNTAVDYVEFIVGDGTINNTYLATKIDPHYYTKIFLPPLEGNYTVYVHAVDIYGNEITVLAGYLTIEIPETPPPSLTCGNITSLGLASQPGVLDKNKLVAFAKLNYYCKKQILGLWDYDFYFEVRYSNGTILNINGVEIKTGKYPYEGANVITYKRTALIKFGTDYIPVDLILGVWR